MTANLCGKPTKRGTPCQSYSVSPEGCQSHMFGDSYAQVDHGEKLRAVAAEAEAAKEPACWSWPVPEAFNVWHPPRDPELNDVTNDSFAEAWATGDDEYRGHVRLTHWQAGRCAICGETDRRIVEDHDHVTGMTRGFLCSACNTREGFGLGGGVIGRYRLRPPAAIIGVRIRYWDTYYQKYAVPTTAAMHGYMELADEWDDNAAGGLRRTQG